MTRTLAWVLCLAAAGILALILFVSRSAGEAAVPDPGSIPERTVPRSDGDLELSAANSERNAEGDEPERVAIASPTTTHFSDVVQAVRDEGVRIPEATITGAVVREEDDQPIAGAEVVVERDPFSVLTVREQGVSGRPVARAMTDGDGRFRCDGLQLGDWTVTATYGGRQLRVEPAKVTFEQPNALVLLKLKRQSSIVVRVVDASGQLATAESLGIDGWTADMLCVAAAPTCGTPGTTFHSDGSLMYRARGTGARILSWALEINGGGSVCIHLLRGDYIVSAREISIGETEVDLQVNTQDLTRDMASCAVRLVDDVHGGPVADVLVKFLPSLGAPREARTDVDGRASASPLPAGPITLDVRVKGYMPLRPVVEIPLREPLVLRLGAGRRLEGIVLDLYGAPLENVSLSVMTENEARTAQGQAIQTRATSGPDGRFAVDSLAHDTYVVRAIPRLRGPPNQPATADPTRIPAESVISQRVDLRDGDSHAVVLRVNRNSF